MKATCVRRERWVKGVERIVFHYVPESREPTPDGRLSIQLAGFGLLVSAVGLVLDVMLLLGSGVGFALGGKPSSGVTNLVVTVAVVLVGTASVICGVHGGRRGRRLGWLWALLAAPIAGVAALVLYGIVTSPAFTWS